MRKQHGPPWRTGQERREEKERRQGCEGKGGSSKSAKAISHAGVAMIADWCGVPVGRRTQGDAGTRGARPLMDRKRFLRAGLQLEVI